MLRLDLSPLLPLLADHAFPGLPALRVLGVPDAARAATVASLAATEPRPVVVLSSRPQRATTLFDEISAWLGDPARVLVFSERDASAYERLPPDPEAVRARLAVLSALREGGPVVVIASAIAAAERTLSKADAASEQVIRRGERLQLESFLRGLLHLGYEVVSIAEAPGQVARRGGIIDIYPTAAHRPVRIELWGDEVESLRRYDPLTQRSAETVDEVRLGPGAEVLEAPAAAGLASKLETCEEGPFSAARIELEAIAGGEAGPELATWVPFLATGTFLEHLPDNALLVVDEELDILNALGEHNDHLAQLRDELERRGEVPPSLPGATLAVEELAAGIAASQSRLTLARFATEDDGPGVGRAAFSAAPFFGGRLRAVSEAAREQGRHDKRVVIVSQQAARLAELFADEGVRLASGTLPAPGETSLVTGLVLWTDTELFGFTKKRRFQKGRATSRDAFLAELSPGDHVVHIEHGIGRFVGTIRRTAGGQEKEFLELRYAENDRLLVPVEQVDRVARYIGPGDHTPTLTRLGSGEWTRAKERVRRAVAELAHDLLDLYAQRELTEGYAYKPDTAWQQEMEGAFPFVETPDQALAVKAVKEDMEAPRPMDRLLCGDVGFGKTEVAVRAAFKAVQDGRQVAVLAPTTVLAQQHWQTFSERLSAFPVSVEMLSRFRSKKEARDVVAGLKDGSVDIVIGTHRLLQKDVEFKDLGLLIIDEEQRFGVEHKERLKRMRVQVDILTLTATPIPRTLHMALTGIRDMSTIETPPENRLPIRTYVTEFDDHIVREAIQRELERGGQVFFLHNRVESIHRVARQVAELVPGAKVGVGHGQLPEEQLERVMLEFSRGELDILVCTTIIESGIDIPNVNTIIINRADTLGLSQLYQLRGRVGRAGVRAYAYMLFEKGRALTEIAQKRLQAVFEAQELGSGFQIALRDLEIRGAGNLLGAEQSGHIAAVGFDLYARLLGETVDRLKALRRGERPGPSPLLRTPFTVDLPLSAHIPEDYVPDLAVRLALYQRIARVQSLDETDAMRLELIDRFGRPPEEVDNLLYIVRARTMAEAAHAEAIVTEQDYIVVRFGGRGVPRFIARWPRLVSSGPTQVRVERAAGWMEALVQALSLVQPEPAVEAVAG